MSKQTGPENAPIFELNLIYFVDLYNTFLISEKIAIYYKILLSISLPNRVSEMS